jgi:orotate phosphoribosyltransferase
MIPARTILKEREGVIVDSGFVIALASLGFTAIGTIATIVGLRRREASRGRVITVDYGSARHILGRRIPKGAEGALGVIAKFVFVSGSGRMAFGTLDKMESNVFLDLFSACTDPALRAVIGRFVADEIRGYFTSERPTHVAVAKEGNVLLADEVARRVGAGLVVVRTKVAAIRFGNPVEGMLPHGAYVVLVDDIAADGEMLARVVKRVRRYGGRVEHAFCAVERLDGNTEERLAACDVELCAPIKLDERTLRELRQLPVQGAVKRPGVRRAVG